MEQMLDMIGSLLEQIIISSFTWVWKSMKKKEELGNDKEANLVDDDDGGGGGGIWHRE